MFLHNFIVVAFRLPAFIKDSFCLYVIAAPRLFPFNTGFPSRDLSLVSARL